MIGNALATDGQFNELRLSVIRSFDKLKDRMTRGEAEEWLANSQTLDRWLEGLLPSSLVERPKVLVTGINRSLTSEQAVEAGRRDWGLKNETELASAPHYEGAEVEMDIVDFNHDPSTKDVEDIYRDGWVPDFHAASRYMKLHPEAADVRPIAIQWDRREDGTAAYALWYRRDSVRKVGVYRLGYDWNGHYRFARFRKVSPVA